jgi:hypothetical protein
MPRRKGRRSFGSLRQLPSGRWQARYRDAAGKSHTAPQTFATRPEAARFLAQVETDLARGEWTDPGAGRVSFAEWAGRWQATTTNLRPNTRALHAYLLRRFLLPAFADTALADLDLMVVRSWLAAWSARPSRPTPSPRLLELQAIGVDHAGQLLITAGQRPERLRGEAAFAHLCGAAPIPASSGKSHRHRLHRGGDRDANRALHLAVVVRMRWCARTRGYAERRTTEGLSKPEILRCVKRYLAREVYHALVADFEALNAT